MEVVCGFCQKKFKIEETLIVCPNCNATMEDGHWVKRPDAATIIKLEEKSKPIRSKEVVRRLVQLIIVDAIKRNATEIHIDMNIEQPLIKIKINDKLTDTMVPPKVLTDQIFDALKDQFKPTLVDGKLCGEYETKLGKSYGEKSIVKLAGTFTDNQDEKKVLIIITKNKS